MLPCLKHYLLHLPTALRIKSDSHHGLHEPNDLAPLTVGSCPLPFSPLATRLQFPCRLSFLKMYQRSSCLSLVHLGTRSVSFASETLSCSMWLTSCTPSGPRSHPGSWRRSFPTLSINRSPTCLAPTSRSHPLLLNTTFLFFQVIQVIDFIVVIKYMWHKMFTVWWN